MDRLGKNRKRIFALVLLKKHLADEDEAVILESYSNNRKSISTMFLNRQEEGAYNILINKHLLDEEEKFQRYFRLTREQFNLIFNDIKDDLYISPCNRVMAPISPAEKLAVTLR